MNLIFAGTPDFAARALTRLLRTRHQIVLVLTQPDKPAGRGMQNQMSAVKQVALDAGLSLHQPRSLKEPQALEPLRQAHAHAMVVAAYGLILPQAALDIPPRGAVNIHASLLPRWRGAAPIQRALLAGDAQTGISIMQMDAGLDTGPVLLDHAVPIEPTDTAGSLHDKLAGVGAELVVSVLDEIEAGRATPRPQDNGQATYASKIERAEARIDWRLDATAVERKIRAFNPVPGAFASLRGSELKIWRAELLPGAGAPGTVLAADGRGITVACGAGALRLLELQRPGARRLGAAEFLRGFPVAANERFDQ
jgi:methionyl-tRNA formyltransferase